MSYRFSGVIYSREAAVNNMEFSVVADSKSDATKKLLGLTGATWTIRVKLYSIHELASEREQKDHVISNSDYPGGQS